MSIGSRLRATAMPEIPGMVERADELKVGDRVRFHEDHQCRWRVRARTDRYVVLTQPFMGTVLYTVIDLKQSIRGGSDSWGTGFETEMQIAESLAEFDSGAAAVSMRNSVRLAILEVKPAAA